MKNPSASTAEKLVACPASHVLPQHEVYTEQADHGTAGHDVLAALVNRRPGARERLDLRFPSLSQKLVHLLDGVGHLASEEAYVVDVEKRTSTYLGKEINRQYAEKLGRPLKPYELGVSLDVTGRTSLGLWMRDWKFGRYSSWWQLHVGGMAILWNKKTAGDLSVDAGFVHILGTNDEEGDSELDLYEDTATLYMADLDDRADELMEAFDRARAMEKELAQGLSPNSIKTVEGKHCQYCGAYPHCPSKWKLAKSMLELDVVGHIGALTREQCGAAWKKLGEIEKNIIKRTKDALKERMRNEDGFPLENGKVLRMVQMPGRTSLDKDACIKLLRMKGCTEIEISQLFKTGDGYDSVRETRK